MSIKLQLKGFDDYLKAIEEAEGDVNKATESVMRQSAQLMQTELKNEIKSANPGLTNSLADRLPPFEIIKENTRITAKVGFKSTNYNPRNLTDYFKAMFANYGTPARSKHGIEAPRGFVKNAQDAARPKIKKAQKEAFEKILKRLKK